MSVEWSYLLLCVWLHGRSSSLLVVGCLADDAGSGVGSRRALGFVSFWKVVFGVCVEFFKIAYVATLIYTKGHFRHPKSRLNQGRKPQK